MRGIWRSLGALWHKRHLERDLDDEMLFHIERETEANIRKGMSAEEARAAALRRFGGVDQMKERCRDLRGTRIIETFFQDLRYGARTMLKKPVYAAVAVLTLALGIGANSAIFTVVNAVLLRPLPYHEPDRIVQLWETNPVRGWTQATVAPANYLDWQRENSVFESMAAYSGDDGKGSRLSNFYYKGAGEPERFKGLGTTGDLFTVLGVSAALGRTFRPEETWQGNNLVVVLSHGLWQRSFGSDAAIIGKTILLNGRERTVIGVMPTGFYYPSKEVELWVPFGWNEADMRQTQMRRAHFLRAIARLKAGVSIEQARAEMARIAAGLEQTYPDTNTKMGVGLGPLYDWVVEDTRLRLLIFLAAVGLILTIACVNVANLTLARASERAREIAIRTALGATRLRLIRQLLTESLLLALIGGLLALPLAYWGMKLLTRFSPGDIPRVDEVSLDWRVIGFTFLISALTALAFGVLPALSSTRVDLNVNLKDGGQQLSSGGGKRLRGLLVVCEVAVSLIVILAAGLVIRSYYYLQRSDPGVDTENILTLRISLPGNKYQEARQVRDFYRQAEERIGALPGVEAVGATARLPLKGYDWTSDLTVEGRTDNSYGVEVRHKDVTHNYFATMRLPIVSGRAFNDSDTDKSTSVIVINEAMARQYFPNEDAIGKRVKFAKPENQRAPWHTIIGVVKNEQQDGLGQEVRPEVYQSQVQNPNESMSLVVRTTGDPMALVAAVRNEIFALDANLPAYDFTTMAEIVSGSMARERFTVLLLGVFAAVALLLAAVGVYGVISYSVTQRTHEFGIRIALGASSLELVKMVIAQGMKIVVAGLVIGIIAALALTRVMASLLYGVSPFDPITFCSVPLLLAIVALVACYIPARRTTKIDPITALRYE